MGLVFVWPMFIISCYETVAFKMYKYFKGFLYLEEKCAGDGRYGFLKSMLGYREESKKIT